LTNSGPVDLLSAVREAVIETDPDFRVVRWNRGAEALYGWSEEEARGRPVGDLLHSRYQEEERAALVERVRERGHVLALATQQTRSGAEVEVEASVIALRGAEGEVSGYVTVSRDVSVRRRLERRLEDIRHLELIAQLAGGIAHDLNTLLTAILGYADLTAGDPALPGHLRADVQEISSAARRAGTLTGQLVAFSRGQMLAPRDVDLDAVVANSLPARRRLTGQRITFVDRPADALTPVHVDPRQLERALLDIVANAADAMPEGGTVTTTTAHENGFARLAIHDTGAGMDAATRSRAFEPFFTTKRGHTGLGLSSVYGIVSQSGGSVTIDSAPGAGTTVLVRLPLRSDDRGGAEGMSRLNPPLA
jgi:two-component system cell cycle sensor histidine kinase/response regulator CckA